MSYKRLGFPSCPGIYSITHVETGRRYIGSSRNVRLRAYDHRSKLRGGTHASPHLQRAWTKYGEGAFQFEVLETCLDEPTILVAREQHWIDHFKSVLLNARPVAEQFSGEWHRTEAGRAYARKHAGVISQKWKDRGLTDRVCQHCGAEFATKSTNAVEAKWCSQRCRRLARKYEKACARCGASFVAHDTDSHYCSKRCRALTNHATRLDVAIVEQIRERLAAGEVQRRIAESLGVSPAAICRIKRCVRYAS